ncbi:hypothetical protein [Vibrio gigantis]|uniref:Uncharacterized protein n=1 Tax=Vibrio gigantis TaxID=296199 RepID=A0A5M9NHG9_9VIBR|nr:hypothetical protein [Vibrio gigantis]KAA8670076.1 hypothetical protein F4W18_17050 [Vibrio gigantis]
MKTREKIIWEILDIYPKLREAKGYIFFGTLQEKPPYETASYHSWRLNLSECDECSEAMAAVVHLLDSLLESIHVPSPRPHGYIKIENSLVTLHWTTRDVVDTMLDNIEKVSKLDHYRIVLRQ